jgi:competence protein ComEC
LVCFITLFLQSRRRLYLHGIFMLFFLFSADLWLNYLHTFSKNKLVVYRISGHSAYEIISRGQAFQFCDSALLSGNGEKIRFHIQPNRLASGVSGIWNGKEGPFSKEVTGGRFTCWNGKTILQLHAFSGLSSELKVDFLILSANAAKDLPGILQKINASKIILDSSNSYFVADKVLNSLPAKDQIHSVWHHGAFETNL